MAGPSVKTDVFVKGMNLVEATLTSGPDAHPFGIFMQTSPVQHPSVQGAPGRRGCKPRRSGGAEEALVMQSCPTNARPIRAFTRYRTAFHSGNRLH